MSPMDFFYCIHTRQLIFLIYYHDFNREFIHIPIIYRALRQVSVSEGKTDRFSLTAEIN